MELISPLLRYAGKLEQLEDLLFEQELQAFEKVLDERSSETAEAVKPEWGARPRQPAPPRRRRIRARVIKPKKRRRPKAR